LHLVFSIQPDTTLWYYIFNRTVSGPPTIEVHDQNDNLVTDYVGDVTIEAQVISTSPTGQEALVVISGTLIVTVVDGVAVFDDIRIDNTDTGPDFGRVPDSASIQLVATAPGTTGVTSDPFDMAGLT
jgi:hypothetical protein